MPYKLRGTVGVRENLVNGVSKSMKCIHNAIEHEILKRMKKQEKK